MNAIGVAEGSNAEVASLAKLSLADIAAQAGKNDDAAKLLSELMDHPTSLVPRARAELALADLYRKSKPAEAAKLYEQIKAVCFPQFPFLASRS